MNIDKFQEFVRWVDECSVIEVNGTLCQVVKEKFDDGQVCAIHFGDIGEDIQDIDLDNDIDRFGFAILSAYAGDCEIKHDTDQYDRPYVELHDERTDEKFVIRRLFPEGF